MGAEKAAAEKAAAEKAAAEKAAAEKAAAEEAAAKKAATPPPAPAPAAPAAKTESALGAVKGGESGGKKLEKETVSAETLDFLKVRTFRRSELFCPLLLFLN